jgi:membrane fusion protein (multidrug efflux system)
MRGMATGPAAALPAIVCILALSSACRRESAQTATERQEVLVPVGAVPAERSGIRAVVRAGGIITPAEGAEFLVVAPEPARIAEIARAEGDPVKSGEVLARFDLPSATQEVARLAADVAATEAQLENARVNQQRVADFVERGLVARRDRDIADRELADTQAALERVRTLHARAVEAAGRALVRAPFDGVVASRRHNPGDIVLSSSTDPVLRIVDPRRLDLVASVGEADIARVVPGATARVAGAAAAMPITLKVVRRLVDRVGTDGGLPFLLVFDEPTTLAVDMRVDVEIDAEERADAVLIPAEALIRSAGENVVMIAAGSRAERRVVTTGIENDDRIEVTSGVRAGELVITRGHIALVDGAAISVAER